MFLEKIKVEIMHKFIVSRFIGDVGNFRKCDMFLLSYAQYRNHMLSYKNIKLF